MSTNENTLLSFEVFNYKNKKSRQLVQLPVFLKSGPRSLALNDNLRNIYDIELTLKNKYPDGALYDMYFYVTLERGG